MRKNNFIINIIKDLKIILPRNFILSLYFLTFFFFISIILEMLSIAIIIPFLGALSGNSNSLILKEFSNYVNIFFGKEYNIIYILLFIIFLIFTLKTFFLTVFSFVQNKIVTNIRLFLTNKLYEIYLLQPYNFFLNRNSSVLIRNISETDLIAKYVKNLVVLINEILVFISITILLLIFEPIGAISVICIVGSMSFFIFKLFKKKLNTLGKIRISYFAKRLKSLQDTFGLIKEIKIYNRSENYKYLFNYNNKKIVSSDFMQSFIDTLPRYWLEWIIIIASLFLCSVLLFLGKDLLSIIAVLGLFALSVYRMLPSIIRITNSFQTLEYNKPSFDLIFKELQKKYTPNQKAFIYSQVDDYKTIVIKDLHFSYSSRDKKIINNVNLKIHFGEIVGIIGESGIGKTTIINLILGIIKPTKGKILIDNKKDIFENINKWQNSIGYVSQNIYLSNDTIKQNIAFGIPSNRINMKLLKKSIIQSNLSGLIKNSRLGLDTPIGEFGSRISGGQKQRIGIARALYNDPKILILDESTSSLDIQTEKKIIEEVRLFKNKKTVIIISHRLSSLKYCDSIYKLNSLGLKKITVQENK
jgi:ABC-type multidrug transport system fused ATPase/permease subunit